MKNNLVIDFDDKHYPDADEWMWNYCIFLGKYTDRTGRNYDLGVHFDYDDDGVVYGITGATVFDNEPGAYSSPYINLSEFPDDFQAFCDRFGDIDTKDEGFIAMYERGREIMRRMKLMNIVPNNKRKDFYAPKTVDCDDEPVEDDPSDYGPDEDDEDPVEHIIRIEKELEDARPPRLTEEDKEDVSDNYQENLEYGWYCDEQNEYLDNAKAALTPEQMKEYLRRAE